MKNKLAREILSKCPEEILEKVRKYAQKELLLYMKKPVVQVEETIEPYPQPCKCGCGYATCVKNYREQYKKKKDESLEKETERNNSDKSSEV